MRILVTGGAGFIGSHFIEQMLQQEPSWQITNLDALTYAGFWHTHEGLSQIFGSRYIFVHDSICNAPLLQQLLTQHDAVVHFAAETNVDLSIADSAIFLQTNIQGSYALLEACRQQGIGRLLVVSTDEVYGEAWQDRPSLESDPLLPRSPYAASKAGQDLLAFSYYETYGVPVVRSRCANNYGPRQDPTKLIPRFILHALHDQPLPLYGSGQNTRDWIHVTDHVQALKALLLGPDSLHGQVFNIGSSVEKSATEIGAWILNALDKPLSLLQQVPDRLGHVRRHAVNTTLIEQTLGWQPQQDWQSGLQATLDWYLQHRDWWQAAIASQSRQISDYTVRYGFL